MLYQRQLGTTVHTRSECRIVPSPACRTFQSTEESSRMPGKWIHVWRIEPGVRYTERHCRNLASGIYRLPNLFINDKCGQTMANNGLEKKNERSVRKWIP
jgi:hypothetical protein